MILEHFIKLLVYFVKIEKVLSLIYSSIGKIKNTIIDQQIQLLFFKKDLYLGI